MDYTNVVTEEDILYIARKIKDIIEKTDDEFGSRLKVGGDAEDTEIFEAAKAQQAILMSTAADLSLYMD